VGAAVKLPLGASYDKIAKATDEELADLLARETAAKEAKIREAERKASLLEANSIVGRANAGLLEARHAISKKQGLRIEERLPEQLYDTKT
jgi:hypothetical protein